MPLFGWFHQPQHAWLVVSVLDKNRYSYTWFGYLYNSLILGCFLWVSDSCAYMICSYTYVHMMPGDDVQPLGIVLLIGKTDKNRCCLGFVASPMMHRLRHKSLIRTSTKMWF